MAKDPSQFNAKPQRAESLFDADSRVACLGPQLTFSHLAALQIQTNPDRLLDCPTIDAVFAAIVGGQADVGIVPLRNSSSGLVRDTADSIARRLLGFSPHGNLAIPSVNWQTPLCVQGSLTYAVKHCLVGWGDLPNVQTVVSKSQALQQCSDWLSNHLPRAAQIASESSAAALQDLANTPNSAAIASREAAQSANIPIIAADIQDDPDNETEFVIVGIDHTASDWARAKTSGKTNDKDGTVAGKHWVAYWVMERLDEGVADIKDCYWLADYQIENSAFQFLKISHSPDTSDYPVSDNHSIAIGPVPAPTFLQKIGKPKRAWRLGIAVSDRKI